MLSSLSHPTFSFLVDFIILYIEISNVWDCFLGIFSFVFNLTLTDINIKNPKKRLELVVEVDYEGSLARPRMGLLSETTG